MALAVLLGLADGFYRFTKTTECSRWLTRASGFVRTTGWLARCLTGPGDNFNGLIDTMYDLSYE